MTNARNEIDLDSLVDYKAEYWGFIKKPHLSGDNLTGLCPFHEDHSNSFSVDIKTGKWHCLTEDIGGNFISFWARIHGIDNKEAYKQILEKYGVTDEERKEMRASEYSYTLKQYAFEKKLPEDWLRDVCKLSTETERGKKATYSGSTYVKFPYLNEEGKEATHRKRFARKEFRWKYGSAGKIGMYGEWRLPEMRNREKPSVLIVEGESDTQSLWYMGIPALGIPGASMFKPAFSDQLQDFTVYIHVEQDQGGETFFRKTVGCLREGGFIGTLKKFTCGHIPGCKDPSDVLIKFGKEEGAKKILHLTEKAETVDLSKDALPEAIKGAPIELVQPEGWIYSDKGLFKIDEKKYAPVLISKVPLILTKRLKSLEDGEEKVEIAWKRDGEWNTMTLPRDVVFTARSITSIGKWGITVNSENAKDIVKYLNALESANMDIPVMHSTSTFGWQEGKRFIPGRQDGIVLDIDPSQKAMAAAYMKAGSMEGWIKTMEPHRQRDKFRFILAASFAAPLLRIIRQRIFFVYNWGDSKGGKTAGLKAALSAWGDPERLMVSFNATQVGLERTAAFYCDLPLGIDERQVAGNGVNNQQKLESIVYMISSGVGKIRGAKGGGLQATNTWRTVAIATGEEPISTETTQTGVSTRVLEIYGGPFEDEKSASLMHPQASEDFGHAGPGFVDRVISVTEGSICDYYDQMLLYINSISNGKAGSHVAGVAAVALADAMIDTWFFGGRYKELGENAEIEEKALQIDPSSWERSQTMAKAIIEEQMSAEAGDVNENAVQFITDWVISNKLYFGVRAVGTCLGDMAPSGNIAYIFPSKFNEALKNAGFSPRKTLKHMAERGLVTSEERKDHEGRNYTIVRKFEGRSCRFIEFNIGALAEKTDELETAGDDEEERYKQGSLIDEDGFISVKNGDGLPFD